MKLNELFEAKYKQWKRGDVVLDRDGKIHTVDAHDGDVKVFMKGHSNGHFHPNNLSAAADDIVDAVKSLGTLDELPAVYVKVLSLMHKPAKGQNLNSMDDGDLKALISKSKGDDKFALRVALKVLGRREPN